MHICPMQRRSQTTWFHDTCCAFKWWTKRKENEKENRTTHEAIKIKPYVLIPCNWYSHTIPSVAELALDPLETVPCTRFKLTLHGKNVVRCNPLLPFQLWIAWCCKTISLLAWPVKVIRIRLIFKPKFTGEKWRILREWLALLHHQNLRSEAKVPTVMVFASQLASGHIILAPTWYLYYYWDLEILCSHARQKICIGHWTEGRDH